MQDPGRLVDHDNGGPVIIKHHINCVSDHIVGACTFDDGSTGYHHDNTPSDFHHATRSDIDKRRFLDLNTAADIVDAATVYVHDGPHHDGCGHDYDESEYVLVRRCDLNDLAIELDLDKSERTTHLIARRLVDNARPDAAAAVLNDTDTGTDDGALWRLLTHTLDCITSGHASIAHRNRLRAAVAARYGNP